MAKLVLVNLDMNQNQLLQAVMQAGDAPANPIAGQFYYDSTKKHAYIYNGTAWELMGNVASVVDADFNASSTNAIQNKAVSTGLVKTFERTINDTLYTLNGKAFDGTQLTSVVIPSATILQAGLMSADDKTKLEGLENVDGLTYTSSTTGVNTVIKSGTTNLATGTIPSASNSAYGVIKVDSGLNANSTNPVQNKTITNTLATKASIGDAAKADSFAAEADSSRAKIIYTSIDNTDFEFDLPYGNTTTCGVTKLDASVTQNGTNPVTGKGIYDYVGDAIAASDAMIFKGTIGTGGTVTALPTTYKTGWTYRVITAGTYAGQKCEVGDLIIALVDRDGTGNLDSDWTVAQTNIDGAITDISTTTPITVSGSGASRTIGHANSGVGDSGGSFGLSANATPAFGATFNVPYVTVDAKGHVTSGKTSTVTIPNNTASSSSAGLMSVDAYNKLYSLVSSAVQKKTGTLATGSKVLSLPISPEYPAEIINVSITTPSGEVVVADVTIDPSGSNVDVVIAQAYSANLTVTVWYVVTE
mgnify:CR=1 FL=1